MKRGFSDRWLDVRSDHLHTQPDCQRCGNRKKLHVHHLIYRTNRPRGMSERAGDLITLCSRCHKDLHKRFGHQLNTSEKQQRQLEWIHNGIDIDRYRPRTPKKLKKLKSARTKRAHQEMRRIIATGRTYSTKRD